MRNSISEEGFEAESHASLESRRIKNHRREEKQVLHAPREQVKQKGFPAGNVKIFIKIYLFDFKMKLILR